MTYSLDIQFLNLPFFEGGVPTPIAHVYIKRRTSGRYPGEMDLDYITPECVYLEEFEAQLDRLNGEIETIRRAARRKFAAAKRKSV